MADSARSLDASPPTTPADYCEEDLSHVRLSPARLRALRHGLAEISVAKRALWTRNELRTLAQQATTNNGESAVKALIVVAIWRGLNGAQRYGGYRHGSCVVDALSPPDPEQVRQTERTLNFHGSSITVLASEGYVTDITNDQYRLDSAAAGAPEPLPPPVDRSGLTEAYHDSVNEDLLLGPDDMGIQNDTANPHRQVVL